MTTANSITALTRRWQHWPLRDRVVYGYGVAYLGLILVAPRFASLRSLVILAFFPLGPATVWAMTVAARASSGAERRVWGCLAAGLAVYAANGLLWTISLNWHVGPGAPLGWDITAGVLIFAALWQVPSGEKIRWRERRVQLDAAMLTVATCAMTWEFGVRPLLTSVTRIGYTEISAFVVTWPLLASVAWEYFRQGSHPRRAAIASFFAAMAIASLSDFLWGELQGRYLPGDWIDVPWFVAWLLRWRAARIAADLAQPSALPSPLRAPLAPSLFVASAYGALVIAAFLDRSGVTLSLGLAAGILTLLLLWRQTVELRETRLLAREASAAAARFRSLITHAPDFVLLVEEGGMIRFASPSVTAAGVARAGDRWMEIVHPDEQREVRRWIETPDGSRLPIRARLRAGIDEWREIELRAHDRRHDPRIGGWVVNGRDVTEEAGLERRVRHSEKLGALHDMAGRVAHAFNNVLSSVLGHAELVAGSLEPGTPWHEDVQNIHSAATRGAAITRQLLGFSDTHASQPVALDVGAVTRGLVPTLERLVAPPIRLEVRPIDAGLVVRADRSQLEQVVVNLVTNARDAMPDGGTVEIRWLATPDEAVLQVRDGGTGIAPEALARIFDPFFTTKAIGRGTGLGLAMVDAIVRRANGRIAIETAVAAGTTVSVHLPRDLATIEGEATPAATSAVPAAARDTVVLLVDDEADVRRVSKRILERAGYTVLEADSGRTAIAIAQDRDVVVDVLVTDMMMPGISGRDVIEVFRQRRPDTPRLCVTGFAALGDDADDLASSVFRIVEKPFTAAILTGAVAAALASAADQRSQPRDQFSDER